MIIYMNMGKCCCGKNTYPCEKYIKSQSYSIENRFILYYKPKLYISLKDCKSYNNFQNQIFALYFMNKIDKIKAINP